MRANTVGDIAAAVRARRQQLHMTQADLAERAGVSTKWIYRVEQASETIELGRLLRVLRALDFSVRLDTTDVATSLGGLVDG